MKRRVVLSLSAVLGAVLIALLSTGVLSKGMLSFDRWVAYAQSVFVSGPNPAVSTDNAVARWNGTGGNSIQDSGVICDDSNNITGVRSIVVNNGASSVDSRFAGSSDPNLIYTNATANLVGIGTSSPRAKLDVQAGGSGGGATTDCAMSVENTASSNSSVGIDLFSGATGTAAIHFGTTSNPDISSWVADPSNGNCSFSTNSLQLNCGERVKYAGSVTGTYSVATTDYCLGITASSAVTLNLPTAASAGAGREYLLVIESGGSAVNVTPNGSDNINGFNILVNIGGAIGIHTLLCNGSAWFLN